MSVSPLQNESELLSSVAGGDQVAFTTLFNHYQRDVYVMGRKLTYSQDLALEIVQEIFMKIWLSREKLSEVENFGGYLNRIVRNHALNVLKKMSQETRSQQRLQAYFTELEDGTTLQLDYHDALKTLDEVLSSLPEQQRMAYVLCHQQGLTYKEAAETMQISPNTLHAHMKQALHKIRAHFKSHSNFYPIVFLFLLK